MNRLLILFAVAVASVFGDNSNSVQDRINAQLKGKNIDPNDSAALIRTVASSEFPIAEAAALGLGYLPLTPESASILRSALTFEDEVLVISAARSLQRLKSPDWTAVAESRLPSIRSVIIRCQLASVLAEAGDFSGWTFIRDVLSDSALESGMFTEAVMLARPFAEMRGPQGVRLSLAHDLNSLAASMPENRRVIIMEEIRQIQSARAPAPVR